MSEFSAVTTTGIYCLPDCSARPDPRNVRRYDTAAAAEAAGFRACLRCRPYRADSLVSVPGPELVCRAVQLILDGALDGRLERDLGSRLGISVRHLRRLFLEHVGVTPDQLARSRRAHFARRLLDDTDLAVSEIAFASGYGSVRQLNRACVSIFRAPPGELRARRRKADRLVADGGLALRLAYDGPLDWRLMLGYLQARAIAGVEHVDGETYRRTVNIAGDPGVLELSAGGPGELLLRLHLPHWAGLIHHVRQARRIVSLDQDTEAVAGQLADDPLLGPLQRALPGARPPGAWDPFETGVRAIVGQLISIAAANAITARLVARLGSPLAGLAPFGLTHLFPSASTLADGDLAGLGLAPARARAINAFARAFLDGQVRLDRSQPLDELVASVTAIPGLGPWTAHYIALRLGEPDAFPAGDLGIRRAVEHHTGQAGTAGATRRLSERWRPHRAHAATLLWLSSGVVAGRQGMPPRAAGD